MLACIALGSNLGNPGFQLRRACRWLRQISSGRRLVVSGIYRSVPVGPSGCQVSQPYYNNAVIALHSPWPSHRLLAYLERLERRAGRRQKGLMKPRTLDLDLLVHGTRTIDDGRLQLPHPRMRERDFVRVPLLEIMHHQRNSGSIRARAPIGLKRIGRLAGTSAVVRGISARQVLEQFECVR